MNTSLKECVQAKSNETRWMVGGTTRQQKGGCDGKRGAEGDGRGGAGRGGNGAPSPSEEALTQRSPGRGHRDTSTMRRGLLPVDRGLDAGLPGLRTGGDGGPVWPIRLAAGRCGGGVHENGTWGRSGHPGPLSYANGLISGVCRTNPVNTFRKSVFRTAMTSPNVGNDIGRPGWSGVSMTFGPRKCD